MSWKCNHHDDLNLYRRSHIKKLNHHKVIYKNKELYLALSISFWLNFSNSNIVSEGGLFTHILRSNGHTSSTSPHIITTYVRFKITPHVKGQAC